MTDLADARDVFWCDYIWDAFEEVAIKSGMAKSVPSSLSGSADLVEGRAPKAADGDFFPGMLC